MADFDAAYNLTKGHEGGYVFDPDDPGGETYKGIARKIHPGWIGWHIIDLMKKQPNFPASLDSFKELQNEIETFYETQYWNTISGSLIQEQAVANSIFDFAVNAGVGTSIKLAQTVSGSDPDGKPGPNTINAVNAMNASHFIAAFTVEKIRLYIRIIKKRPASLKYFFGWVSRALGEN